MSKIYENRVDAGRQLAEHLKSYKEVPDVLVLGLPRGGIPVAYEVARAIAAPLDALIVRKLGYPPQPELAMGAIASGGVRVLNEQLVRSSQVDEQTIARVEAVELEELRRREQVFRGDRPFPNLADKCVILVDDGLATGSTMRAAVMAVKKQNASRIVVAVAVAPPQSLDALRDLADEVVCPLVPEGFFAIGQFYQEFLPTADDQVRDLLSRAAEPAPANRVAQDEDAKEW